MLDRIVSEVKASEEWEEVQMDILEIGINQGISQGIRQGISQGIRQGISQGISQGIGYGEMKKLVTQVCKKIVKGYTAAEIADIFEEDEGDIQYIYDVAQRHAPDYDVEAVFLEIKEAKNKVILDNQL